MTADPQLRERLERAAAFVDVDTELRLGRIRGYAARRQRGRRIQALAVAAAIGLFAVVIVWRLQFPGGPSTAPAAGPTGRIAYISDGLFALDVATGESISILESGGGAIFAAQWSPDGSRVAFVQRIPDPRRFAVVVADADGSNPVSIVEEPDTGAVGPDVIGLAWSPDGTRIAYAGRTVTDGVANRTILIASADGSGTPIALDGHWEWVSWSPDGERLLLSGFPHQTEGGQFDLYTARPDGSDLVRLTDDDRLERSPVWSPDGTQIVFSKSSGPSDPVEYDHDIYVMNADGADLRRLTDWKGLDFFPVWSPNGAWIAFSSDRDASPEQQRGNRGGLDLFGGLSMYVMRADGSDVRKVVDAGVRGAALPTSWAA